MFVLFSKKKKCVGNLVFFFKSLVLKQKDDMFPSLEKSNEVLKNKFYIN